MTQTDTSVEFTRDEIVAELEKAARRLNMTVPEMLRAFAEGTLRDTSSVFDALALSDILPTSDPLRVKR